MLENIADEVLSRFGSWILRMASGLLNVLIDFFDLSDFRPTFTYFNDKIISGEENVNNIFACFQYVAFVILVILFAWNVAAMVVNKTYKDKDVKDNLRTLFIRSVVCIMLISASQFICRDVLAPTVDGFYKYVLVPLVGQGTEGDSGVLTVSESETSSMMDSLEKTNNDNYTSHSIEMTEDGSWVANDSIGAEATQAVQNAQNAQQNAESIGGAIIGFVACIVEAYFIFSILYNYLKLIIELARRYAKWCFMYITFPLPCATYISTATENIFLNYLGGFVNEAIAIVISVFVIRMTNWFMQVCSGNFLAVFFILGWINIGIAIEQFMREHGFVIGSSGGSLLDNMLQASHNMSHLGRGAVQKTGRGIIGAAAISNNVPLAKVGTAMAGLGIGDAVAMSAMRSSIGGAINRGMNGGNEHMGAGQMAAMDRMFRRSGDLAEKGAFLSSYNMLGAEDQARYANHLLNDVVGADNIREAMGLSNDASLQFSDVTMDQKGNIVGTAETDMGSSSFILGTDATDGSIGLTGNNNDAMHLAFNNGEIADMEDGIELDKVVSEDALASKDITGNPLSTMGGFSANDINALMNSYDDHDLSKYTFSTEGGVPHIDYANGDGAYNGIMKAQDGQTFNSAAMCSDFNGTYTIDNSSAIDSSARWDAKDSDENYIYSDYDIRRKLRINSSAPAEFASFGIREIHSIEYKNGQDSSNGYVLNCNMKNGNKKMYDYIPASEHASQVKKGATVIRKGGLLAEHKEPKPEGVES